MSTFAAQTRLLLSMNNHLSIVSIMLIGLLLWTVTACQDQAAPAQEAPVTAEVEAGSEAETVTSTTTTATPADKSKMTAYQENMRTLIVDEENAEEPCTAYRVVNGNNASVEVSAALKELLSCPSFVTTSVVGNILIVSDDKGDLQRYNYEEQKLEQLLDLPNNSDGLSHVRWSVNNEKLAFVNVNKNSYAEKTMLYVLTFQNGELTDQVSHSVKINFSCDSICAPLEKDFGFTDNETIYYRTYDNTPYDIKGDSNKKTLALNTNG